MKKSVEQVLIATGGARTSSLIIGGASDNMVEGEVVVLDKDKNILSAGASFSDTDTIYLVEGLGSTYDYVNEAGTSVTDVRQLLYSNPIKGADVTGWSGVSYSPPAEAVWTVDLTGWVPVVGTEYLIKIVYKDIETTPRQFSKTYQHIAATAALATELTSIVAMINSDTRRRVIATEADNTDLILTGLAYDDNSEVTSIDDYKQVNFEVFLISDNFDTYTLSSLTTVPTQGSGHWRLVRDEEKWSQGYEGQTNRTAFPVIGPSFRTVKNETYDTLVMNHKNSYENAGNRMEQVDISTKVFLPENALQTTSILAVLNPWMESLPGSFASVSV